MSSGPRKIRYLYTVCVCVCVRMFHHFDSFFYAHQLMIAMATLHPLEIHSSGGAPVIRLARMPPEEATMNVMTQEATGCCTANSTLPETEQCVSCCCCCFTHTWLFPECVGCEEVVYGGEYGRIRE